jgi:hypothetical protein
VLPTLSAARLRVTGGVTGDWEVELQVPAEKSRGVSKPSHPREKP